MGTHYSFYNSSAEFIFTVLLKTLRILKTLRFASRFPCFNTCQSLKIHRFLKLVKGEAAVYVTKGVPASQRINSRSLHNRLLHNPPRNSIGFCWVGHVFSVKGRRVGPPTSPRMDREAAWLHSLALETAAESGGVSMETPSEAGAAPG